MRRHDTFVRLHLQEESAALFGLVDVVEGEGDLSLAEHVPGPVEEFGCDLGVHDVVDHGVYVCSAVELSCELWRDPVRHIRAGVCFAVDEW